MFVDETVTGNHPRRRSTTDEDHSLSPVGIDPMDIFLPQNPSVGSPASRPRQDSNLRFPNPMTPPSNPHTPASPSASRISSVSCLFSLTNQHRNFIVCCINIE